MALHVLAYNLTRVMNIIGVRPLMDAIKGRKAKSSAGHVAVSPCKHRCWHFYTTKT